MKKRNESLRKAGMLIFLVLIVIGFSVPLFLSPLDQSTAPIIEPRVCQDDADCYLTCDSGVVASLCFQNLCMQNACDESSPFPYQQEPSIITLSVMINGQKLPLAVQSSSQDIFVQFEGDAVKLYSDRLSLSQILEKAGIIARYPCLISSGISYCVDNTHKLQFHINGVESFQYENYLPDTGDAIRIEYS